MAKKITKKPAKKAVSKVTVKATKPAPAVKAPKAPVASKSVQRRVAAQKAPASAPEAAKEPREVIFNGSVVVSKVEGGKENEFDIECKMADGTTTMVPKKLFEAEE